MSSAKPTLSQLSSALKKVQARWYELGLELGFDADDLDAIKCNNLHDVGDRLRDLLKQWQEKYPHGGWEDIVSALREMNKNDLADVIEENHVTLPPRK